MTMANFRLIVSGFFVAFALFEFWTFGAKVHWLMANVFPPSQPTITLPHRIVSSLPDGLVIPSGSHEYFSTGSGILCVKANAESRIKITSEELLSEPGVSYCDPTTFPHRLIWSIGEAWRT